MSITAAHPSGLRVRTADLSLSRPPEWAWQDRIVLGYLNLLLGNEGVGKGTLVAWLISRLTRGELPGNLRHRPSVVGIVGDEDSFDDVWTPRLYAAGADLSLVRHLDRPDGGYLHLAGDREKITEAVDLEQIRVLFFDQLLDNLGAAVDDWHGKSVRDALQPVRAIGRELNVAVIGAMHPNKRGNSFRELLAGSAAFNAVSRSSLLLAQHPEDESRRVLVRGKGNLSATPTAVEFTITTRNFNANGHEFDIVLAADFRTGDLSIDELIEAAGSRTIEHSKVADAGEIIEALLPHDGAWHAVKPIYDACAGEEIDDRTIKRAKQRLRVEHRRTQTFPASSEWRWPIAEDTVGPSENTGPSVPTVPTAKSPSLCSGDTQDRQERLNASPQCVPTSENGRNGSQSDSLRAVVDPDAEAELARIGAKFGAATMDGDAIVEDAPRPMAARCSCREPFGDGETCSRCGREP